MHQHEALTKEKDTVENKEHHNRSKRLFHASQKYELENSGGGGY